MSDYNFKCKFNSKLNYNGLFVSVISSSIYSIHSSLDSNIMWTCILYIKSILNISYARHNF